MENGSSSSPPAAAAAPCRPCWVMLDHFGHRDSIVADQGTAGAAAASCTSTDLLFHVSLVVAAPPASSRFYYGWSDRSSACVQDGEGKAAEVDSLSVIAAHADAVLLGVRSSEKDPNAYFGATRTDYFLYEYETAGTGTARLPSLLKLPGCYDGGGDDHDKENQRVMTFGDTGLLRCGGGGGGEHGGLLVAQLEVSAAADDDKPWDRAAELRVLRVGQEYWELKQAVPIICDDRISNGGDHDHDEVMRRWQTDTTVPVGDRFLCWVDYLLGFLFCDMAATAADDDASVTNNKLRYVALPVVPPKSVDYWDGRPYMRYSRDLAGAGAGAVRFVDVEPRCCCGGRGRSTCARGPSLFTVTTWTLCLGMDQDQPLEWVKERVLDCDELWALPAYKDGLPRVTVKLPVVSLDNPDVIWFLVQEDVQDYDAELKDRRAWMVEVDTRSKTLLSVVVPNTDCWTMTSSHVAAKLRCSTAT